MALTIILFTFYMVLIKKSLQDQDSVNLAAGENISLISKKQRKIFGWQQVLLSNTRQN